MPPDSKEAYTMENLGIYLNFNGNCADVLQFYAKVFETKTGMLMRYGDAPDSDQFADFKDKIIYSDMIVGGQNLMLSDVPPGGEFVAGNNFCITFTSNDQDKLHRIFNELKEGGTIIMPMGKTFFSELFGMVTDKFGITWNLTV